MSLVSCCSSVLHTHANQLAECGLYAFGGHMQLSWRITSYKHDCGMRQQPRYIALGCCV